MRLVYPVLKKARGLVIASPVYWFSVSAQTKIFMDRLYAFIGPKGHGLKGKNIGILLTYGDVDPFSSGAVNALRMFQDAFTYVGAPIAGMVYGSANAAGEVNENKALLRDAATLGRQVAGGA
ncbi:MAG: NAD(P)H-dependent oxidoreductase [Spirochaetes bacterium]|nr:NAD(P)H-dependent oxidoreductase [Spirochaetota bacterium]